MPLGMEVGLGPVYIVLDGDTAPLPKKGAELGMEVGLSAGDFVLDGDPSPTPKGAEPHPIFGHVNCGQTATWIKMPLGTEVGLSPGDSVFNGDPTAPHT